MILWLYLGCDGGWRGGGGKSKCEGSEALCTVDEEGVTHRETSDPLNSSSSENIQTLCDPVFTFYLKLLSRLLYWVGTHKPTYVWRLLKNFRTILTSQRYLISSKTVLEFPVTIGSTVDHNVEQLYLLFSLMNALFFIRIIPKISKPIKLFLLSESSSFLYNVHSRMCHISTIKYEV